MEASSIVAVPADQLMLAMTWQALWFCLVAFWLGIMGWFAGQWLGELGDWLSDHVDRRFGHRISAWLALRRARAARSINARETVYADWPGPRVASTGPHVNQRPDAGMAPAGGPAPGHTTRNAPKPSTQVTSRPESGIQGGSAPFTCAGGGAACSSCLPVGRCAADCPY